MAEARNCKDKKFAEDLLRKAAKTNAFKEFLDEQRKLKLKSQGSKSEAATSSKDDQDQSSGIPKNEAIIVDSDNDKSVPEKENEDPPKDFDGAGADSEETVNDSSDEEDDYEDKEDDVTNAALLKTSTFQNLQKPLRNNSKSKRNKAPSSELGYFEKVPNKRPRHHSAHGISESQPQLQYAIPPPAPCSKSVHRLDKTKKLTREIIKKNAKIRELERELQQPLRPQKPNLIKLELETVKKANVKYRATDEVQKATIKRQGITIEKMKLDNINLEAKAKLLDEQKNRAEQVVDDVVEEKNLQLMKANEKLIISEDERKKADSALKKMELAIQDYEKADNTRKKQEKLCSKPLSVLNFALGIIVEENDSSLLHVKLQKLLEKVSDLKFTSNDLEIDKAKLEGELKRKKKQLMDLKSKYRQLGLHADKKLGKERKDWYLTKETLETQVKSLKEGVQRNEELEEQNKNISLAKLALETKVNALQKEYDNVSSELEGLHEKEANFLTKAQQSTKEIEKLEAEKRDLELEKGDLQAKIKPLKQSLGDLIMHLELLLVQDKEYQAKALENKEKIAELKIENIDLSRGLEKSKLELKIVTLTHNFERLKSFLGGLLQQVGEKEEDYNNKTVSKNGQQLEPKLKLERQVKNLQNLSLDLTKLLQSWDEYKIIGCENASQVEKSALGLWYAIKNLDMATDETEKDMIWKQEELVKSFQIMRVEEKVESLEILETTIDYLEANAHTKTNADQTENISKLRDDMLLCQCQTKLEAIQMAHNEEVDKLNKIILALQSSNQGQLNENLVKFLMESAQDYQKTAAAGEQKIAKLEGEIVKLKSENKGVTEHRDRLMDVIAKKDIRIENLERSLQDLLQSLRQKGEKERKSNIETLLASYTLKTSSSSVVVAAASTRCSAPSVAFDPDAINGMQEKSDSGALKIVLPLNLVDDSKEEDGRNYYQDDDATPFDKDASATSDLFALSHSPSTFPSPKNDTSSVLASSALSSIVLEVTSASNAETHAESCPPPPNVQSDEAKQQIIANKQLEFLAQRKTEDVISPRERQCDICYRVCSTKSNLKQHINLKHLRLCEVRCNICNRGPFQNPSNLTKHIRQAHYGKGDVATTVKGKKKNETNETENTGTSNNNEKDCE